MTTGDSFQEFGRLIDDLESEVVDITNITSHGEDLLTDESLSLDLSVGVPLFDDVDTTGVEISPQELEVQTDGTLTVDFSVQVPLNQEVEENLSETQLEPTPDQRDESKDGDSEDSEVTEPKPYQNTDRLKTVYEEYDTFSEMTEALEVDVTPETVRSNMIKQGIHEPQTSDGDTTTVVESDSSDDTQPPKIEGENQTETEEVVLSDGMGLPAGITLEEFKTTIQNSQSFLDVQRELDGNRDYTYDLLKQLNLLDLVHGRISKQGERETSLEEIESRIRQSTSQ